MAVNLIGRTDIIKHVFDDGVSRRATGATQDLVGGLIYRQTRSLKCSEIEHMIEYSSNIRANKFRKGPI
jgi:hypothetical protein